MTPEQRDEMKLAMQRYIDNPAETRLCGPEDILALIAQVEALTVPQWISVEDRMPEPGVLVMVWQPRQEWNYPDDLLISFDCIDPDDDDAATWRGHNNWYEEYCVIGKPEGSTGPSQDAPYTHWKPMDAAPTIPAIPGTKEGA